MFRFIDTHCHWCDEAFSERDIDQGIAKARQAGVDKMLQADIDSKERDKMFDLCRKYSGCLIPMLGLYPGSVDSGWRNEIDAVGSHDRSEVIAVGEIGLDYHFSDEFSREQKEAFRTQLELASEWDLPVNIHLRDATEDFLSIMDDCRHLHIRGNLHAFGGSAEFFSRVSYTGEWYVGIGGVVTFKNAKVAKSLESIPASRILLETDAPYLTPVPHRGERNESSYIPLIANKIAEIKGLSAESIATITTENAINLFGDRLK